MAAPFVTLTTDFGARDPYVAAMKGVLHRYCPEVRIEDLGHEIAPQAVTEAALFLEAALPEFPPGTVHLAVVDPGVGTARRPIAARAGGHLLVFPDNGIMTPLLRRLPLEEARLMEQCPFFPPARSATFHGRDVFAPAAAWLAMGNALDTLGPPAPDLVELRMPEAAPESGGAMLGEVIHVDRFGNCVTNLVPGAHAAGMVSYSLSGSERVLPLSRAYGDAEPGALLALTGSMGRIEIALNGGDAARTLGIVAGLPVRWTPEG